MADPARVLEDALQMEPRLRARLAHELIRSLDDDDPEAADLWREEIRRRIDEVQAGTTTLDDWEDVRGRLRARFPR